MPLFLITVPAGKPNVGDAASRAGLRLRQLGDGSWVADVPTQLEADAVQAFVDAFDPVTFARTGAKLRLRTALARRTGIDGVQNDAIGWLAEALRLTATNCGTALAAWPAAARTRILALNAKIKRFEDLTAAADLIGADIDALTDPSAIEGFDPEASGRWPA